MGINEGSLQVSYRYRGDIGKLTYSITIRYIPTSSSACGVRDSHNVLHICDSMSKEIGRVSLVVHNTCVCVCVFFPSILDIKFVGRTSRGHTGGRSHRIF